MYSDCFVQNTETSQPAYRKTAKSPSFLHSLSMSQSSRLPLSFSLPPPNSTFTY
ncbi:hypothetical protein HanIR_Chr15g0767781 [Helianthus annuus]|nr:hypothetical protein HanIR_Chr15g0767781 [Helianthus annuus]